jgi:hypothetical protein
MCVFSTKDLATKVSRFQGVVPTGDTPLSVHLASAYETNPIACFKYPKHVHNSGKSYGVEVIS